MAPFAGSDGSCSPAPWQKGGLGKDGVSPMGLLPHQNHLLPNGPFPEIALPLSLLPYLNPSQILAVLIQGLDEITAS